MQQEVDQHQVVDPESHMSHLVAYLVLHKSRHLAPGVLCQSPCCPLDCQCHSSLTLWSTSVCDSSTSSSYSFHDWTSLLMNSRQISDVLTPPRYQPALCSLASSPFYQLNHQQYSSQDCFQQTANNLTLRANTVTQLLLQYTTIQSCTTI